MKLGKLLQLLEVSAPPFSPPPLYMDLLSSDDIYKVYSLPLEISHAYKEITYSFQVLNGVPHGFWVFPQQRHQKLYTPQAYDYIEVVKSCCPKRPVQLPNSNILIFI